MKTDYELNNCKAELKQMEPLVGGTITGLILCRSDSEGEFLSPPAWGFKVRKGVKNYLCWVDMDPEGNGPGHIGIEQG